MVALAIAGIYGYVHLGQAEDPPFTFNVMVVRTLWPGASALEVEQQLTDKIEKKLQETPNLKRVVSYSKPGESVVMVIINDSTPGRDMPPIFYQVRKKVGDIRHTLPSGIKGPFFNDEFGDVFGNVYALTGDGLNYAQLKDYADTVRDELLRVPNVAKVDLFGVQDQRIYLEISNTKLAMLGLNLSQLADAIANQNAVTETGFVDLDHNRLYIRPSGAYDSVAAIRDTILRIGNREMRIGDFADVQRGYAEPAEPSVRFMGQPALGIGVSMAKGGDIIRLGHALHTAVAKIQQQLPVGIEVNSVASQPIAVKRSVNAFLTALAEAVVIVLIVNFLSLGFRTGMVVALTIPLVLAITFMFMWLFGVGLHKISLGALILALGLLVDDAIIAVEMMWVKMEQGWERSKAAAFAYTSTAGPMLSGTLVTTAGFLPIAMAASSTGEYTVSIFQVNAIALLVSWVAAVVVIPYLGYRLLPDPKTMTRKSLITRLITRKQPTQAISTAHDVDGHAIYQTPFYVALRRLVNACVQHRWLVIGITVAIFALAIFGFRFVQQQFFPSSTRLELLVDLRLEQGASHRAVEEDVRKLENYLQKQPGIDNFVAYVGWGSPRFYLALDQQLPASNFAQVIILTQDIEAREKLREQLIKLFDEDFTDLQANIGRLENGPPVGYPVQFRVTGPDASVLRGLAQQVANVMGKNSHLDNINFDWSEMSKIVQLNIDQDKLRLLGISRRELTDFIAAALNGVEFSTLREGDESISIMARGDAFGRNHLGQLADLAIHLPSGASVPLAQIAKLEYTFEPGVIWRRDRMPTITVRGNVYGDIQAPTVTAQIDPQLDAVRTQLPPGYRLEVGGTVEESASGQQSVNVGMPVFLLVVFTVLMIQLQNISRVVMVVLTAPLGLIGVALFLLLFKQPFGFVAMLGTIALFGMIMRNSVILVDQIQQDIASGKEQWTAIVDSAVRRFRLIVLTAAAAVLAMIPLTQNTFFGPMAVAIMGGLIVATLLTLLFLPALYAAWYRVKAPTNVTVVD